MPQISKDVASEIAMQHLKRQKNTDKIDIVTAEINSGEWVFRGTCPVDLQGHQWAEKFEVIIDAKGKVKSSKSALL
jgi:hypothetical protein